MISLPVPTRDPARLAPFIGEQRAQALEAICRRIRGALGSRRLVNISDVRPAGPFGDMLRGILGYCRGAGAHPEWYVLHLDDDVRRITQRIHDNLNGEPGDGGPLGPDERQIITDAMRPNFVSIRAGFSSGDVAILQDPGTAGLIPFLSEVGGAVTWRCHTGSDARNEHTQRAWQFLNPLVGAANRVVVNRPSFVPPIPRPTRVSVMTPCIDPCSTRNRHLSHDDARQTLVDLGIVDGRTSEAPPTYVSETGDRYALPEVAVTSQAPIPATARIVAQVGKWEHRADLPGVIEGFGRSGAIEEDVHLLLCGVRRPDAIRADAEAAVLEQCHAVRNALAPAIAARVHLVSVPTDRSDASDHIVNAVQTAADVIVQKNHRDGFSLTLIEAMWKRRPVIASAVGGLWEQIADKRDGLLLGNPRDLVAFGNMVAQLLSDTRFAARLGEAAHTRVQRAFLPDRYLLEYANLLRGH